MISSLLLADIDDYVTELRASSPLLRAARDGTLPRQVVGLYLRSLHYLLGATPEHLSLAARLAEHAGTPELGRHFEKKIREEVGHDRWAEADIRALEALFGAPVPPDPSPAMVAMVENTRSLIERDPHLYLAYMLFAEYFTVAIGPDWLKALEQGCGVPTTAMTACANHVELDADHAAEGCAEIDRLAAAELLPEMRGALASTIRHFSLFCDDLARAA